MNSTKPIPHHPESVRECLIAIFLFAMTVGLFAGSTSLAQESKKSPTGSKPNSDLKVKFGDKKAPVPTVDTRKERRHGEDEEDSSVVNALRDWFANNNSNSKSSDEEEEGDESEAEDEDEEATEWDEESEDSEEADEELNEKSLEEDKENAEAEEDGAGEGKNLFKKFVNLFQGKDEDPTEGEDDENYRKIKELERFAERNFEKERFAEAKKNLNDLITLKPYEPGYHFALGLIFRKEKRYEDALKKYQDVLDLGGPKPLVHVLMAEAVSENGESDKIFEHLKEAAVGGRNIIHDVQRIVILEEYRADTEFIKLALSLEKYELKTKKNQDPMTNPFEMRNGDKKSFPGSESDGPELLTPEEQQKLLSDARKAYDRVLWYIKLEDEEKAMENYIELRKFINKSESINIPKISNDFRLLVSRMEPLEAQIEGIRLKFYYNQALAQLRIMKQAFHDGGFSQVKAVFEEVKKLSREMERTNPRYRPVAERILGAGTVWLNRTAIREEFNSNKPVIHGIIISSESKKAIINNRIYRQGEQFKEFLVQKVENNRITFRYKGEEIPLIFRRY